MTNLSVFSFNSNDVRTFADDHNEMWFCANDVCKVLGYSNPAKTINDHCKDRGVTKRYTGVSTGKKANGDDATQNVEMTYINEPNLYRLIIKSRKPEAEAFEAHVMEVILPTIRKTGSYTAPERKTKQVLIGGLTADQQDAIKALVKARAEALPTDKRAKATISMWSAVKTKYKDIVPKYVNYKSIPPEEYGNVISLIARLPLEGEFIAATDAPKAIEAPTPVPSIAPDFNINRTDNWHTNFQQGQEAVNAIRVSVCTGNAKLLDQVKYAMRNAQAQIYKIDFCADGISTGYIDMISRYAIIGMQACNTPLVANRI